MYMMSFDKVYSIFQLKKNVIETTETICYAFDEMIYITQN